MKKISFLFFGLFFLTTKVFAIESNAAIAANNKFALDLYSQLQNSNKNIFVSPYSISSALAILYDGARSDTAKELQRVMHFSSDDSLRRTSFLEVKNQLNKIGGVNVVNALWLQDDYKFLNSYLSNIEKYYEGSAKNIDFKNSPTKALKQINQWVESKTNNKIKNLLEENSINEATKLVITNAIYFKGAWNKQFKKSQTKEEYFYLNKDNKIKVLMMSLNNSEFNYVKTNDCQALEMPYLGEKLSMIILLPNNNLSALEKNLTLETISNLKAGFKKQAVDIFIPKFTFNDKYFLKNTLSTMGMPTAFSKNADFSGINGDKELVVEQVIHQAFIDVNEEGSEAAAATAVKIKMKSSTMIRNPIIFRADRPFIFLIQDKESGNILFLGRIINF